MTRIRSHEDLEVYQIAFSAASRVFKISQEFPAGEQKALTEPMRNSSRAVCTRIAEGWRKRRSRQSFIECLSEAEAEAGSTQSLLAMACDCGYVDEEDNRGLQVSYDHVLGKLVGFIANPEPWLIQPPRELIRRDR